MSALLDPEDSYQPPAWSGQKSDSDEHLVDAAGLDPEQRHADDNPALKWGDLDDGLRQTLNDDFVQWFQHDGRSIFLKAAHSVCGRKGDELACDAAVKVYEQWPDSRKRALFKTSPRYVYQTVRNLFLDDCKKSQRRREQALGSPEEVEDLLWETDAVADPGSEVRHAINLLDQQKSELIFLSYWLRMNLSEAARHLGVTRGKAERLSQAAHEKLRVLLEEED